ncbi:MAG TPA: AMP-binding protein [Candidatus Sulfotelmatobacter sp.]|nr:AMP-binding protein [Candidatus Sulfotelmatobacter sp.]
MTDPTVAEVLACLPARVSDVVKPWAERSPDHPALVEAAGTWTYHQLDAAIEQTKEWLSASSVRAGDRVMIVCENCRALVAIFMAANALDAWPVPVNAHLAPAEIDKIRDHCRPRLIIYTAEVSPRATDHANRHSATATGPEVLGKIRLGAPNLEAAPEPLDTEIQSRVAAMIYTSGTTGLPKGVMLTHRNLLYVATMTAKIRSLTPDDRLYGALPMSHVVGLSVVLLGTLLTGATLYLAPRFDPMTARKALEKDQLTVVLGVPAMFAQFLQYAKMRNLTSLKFPALRLISCSGAPLHAATKRAVEQLFGLPLHNGYGVTETSPNISQTRPESPRSDTSTGPIFPGVEIKLLGQDDKPVPDGEVGELWVKGPNLMKGYYRAPEETAAALDGDGYFNTRDLVRLEDGNLFIVGRAKDLIIRSGFNVYPSEVEAALNSHPMVAQSAVIGRTLEEDEEVIAFVQLSAGSSLTTRDLAEYAAQHLAPYKRPSRIVILSSMPVTPTGKIIKGELAKFAASGIDPDAATDATLTSQQPA